MTVYSCCGKGNRVTNEVYIRSVQFENNTSLHIVADGMGGYLYGEIAAQVATDAIESRKQLIKLRIAFVKEFTNYPRRI